MGAPAHAVAATQSSSDDPHEQNAHPALGGASELAGLSTQQFKASAAADRARMVTEEAKQLAAQAVATMLVARQETTKLVESASRDGDSLVTVVFAISFVFLIIAFVVVLRPDALRGPGANLPPVRRSNDGLVAQSTPSQGGKRSGGRSEGPAMPPPAASGRPASASDMVAGPVTADRPSVDPEAPAARRGDMKSILKKALCPGLVVPRSCECLLAVPTLQSCGIPPQREVSFVVPDLNGMQVLLCDVRKPDWDTGEACTMLVLKAASPKSKGDDPPVLGYCKAGPSRGAQRSVIIQNAKRENFASFAQDPWRPAYTLSYVSGGAVVMFEGNFAANMVNIMDESQVVLADTMPCQVNFEPSKSYYKLRASSRVDMGLLLCCLISIQLMEMK